MSEFRTGDGCIIHYEEKGRGEPLIFVHGWSATSEFFHRQREYFSDYYRVITYDLRGHGKSDKRAEIIKKDLTMERYAKDIKELADYLGLSDFNICGWSMGVSILLCYIQMFGDKDLKTLSLIDMTPKLLNENDWTLGDFGAYENLEFLRDVVTDWKGVAVNIAPELFARGFSRESELYKWVLDRALNNEPYVMAAMWLAMALGDYRGVLSDISIPTFLAYSSGGDMYGPEHGEYMNERIPKSELDLFENCGHALFLENPDKFNHDYHEFLKKHLVK